MIAPRLFVGLACLALAGCFVSDQPLIAPDEAEFPLATPASLTRLRADGTGEVSRLERDGATYLLTGPTIDGPDGPTTPSRHRFVVRAIGEGLYLVQQYADSGSCPCFYGVIERSGARFGVHDFTHYGTGPQLSADEMARFGVTADGQNNYQLSTFAGAAALFRELLARPRPNDVYELK